MSDGALRVEGAAVHLETPWRLRLEAADEQEAWRVLRVVQLLQRLEVPVRAPGPTPRDADRPPS